MQHKPYISPLPLATFFIVSLCALPAFAQTPIAQLNPFAEMATESGQQVGFFMAGIAIIVAGLLAFFGKFRWGLIAAAVGAIVVIGGGQYIIDFARFDAPSNEILIRADAMAKQPQLSASKAAYGVGGLAAIGLGVLAMLGRFKWSWFFAIVGGLAVLAGINQGFSFVAGQGAIR